MTRAAETNPLRGEMNIKDEMETLSQDLGSLTGVAGTAKNFRMMAAKARHVALVYDELAETAEYAEVEEAL